ncbi:uncharacterized protein Z518_09981 [Rhinocladiella mackenziei CBS 650.93]|uniref:Rhinocladiella mackenziei CBS 650.93 unplaced genomic scaffold supercont1.8, whole genome shotgun sequence n=1 Tax=Rhinocladiella mackenziei CBS 650.93 TaxID=1442369 RepID=A0A0D2ICD5_9EURO|nr:uncharacterized protein Z518_09981 [Rhinocladiella mackenziei CBS 650.93]KIX00916.1 hypothetical protein Z518_09981 [Rhinocladiella mackenziei CBS 650.93]
MDGLSSISHPLLEELLKHPDLDVVTPSSPYWTSIRATYIADNPARPIAIARPQSIEEVATFVRAARSHSVKLSVRPGGRDAFGRSTVDGALVVDMRSIKSIEVSQDRKTATVGGGVLNGDLITELSRHGLVTPFGYAGAIGYPGWAMMGGYGWLAPNVGLGVDQIVSARVVNWKGEVLEADAELLKGIRGAGGNFGMIVELGVKVYELKSFLAGPIMFNSTNIKETLRRYFQGYNAMTKSPYGAVSPFAFPHPERGWTFTVNFAWSSPDMEAEKPEWIEFFVPLTPTGPDADNAVSFQNLSEKTVDVIADYMSTPPADAANVFLIREMRGPSAEQNPHSCFGPRSPHFVLELVGVTTNESHVDASRKKIRDFFEALKATGEAMDATYVSMTQDRDTNISQCFGDDWPFVLELKEKYDPEGIFDAAVPRLKRV